MSGGDSTETVLEPTGALEAAAARGELPDWGCAGPKRQAHMARVSRLLEGWARELELPPAEILTWSATGWLHDALRDADPRDLVNGVDPLDRDLPGRVLHGPAAAARLAGTIDPRAVNAIRYHTLGHPSLDRLGRALYLADFLEPGRNLLPEWTAALRARMPFDLDAVLVEVLAARIGYLIDRRLPLRPETCAFWSVLMKGGGA